MLLRVERCIRSWPRGEEVCGVDRTVGVDGESAALAPLPLFFLPIAVYHPMLARDDAGVRSGVGNTTYY